jgi:hypothetical protein
MIITFLAVLLEFNFTRSKFACYLIIGTVYDRYKPLDLFLVPLLTSHLEKKRSSIIPSMSSTNQNLDTLDQVEWSQIYWDVLINKETLSYVKSIYCHM